MKITKTPTNNTNQKKFWALSGVLMTLTLTYLSLVGFTVSNTLERQRAEKAIANIQTEVSELEFTYMALSSSLTLEKAKNLGFVEVDDFSVARDDSVAIR